jgi:hypothetical protein
MNLPRTGPAWALVALLIVAAPLGARAGAQAGVLPAVLEWRLGGRTTPLLAPNDVAASPVRVQIPAIGVDAPVTPVDLRRDGSLAIPAPEEVGWYRRTPAPGNRGSAVVTGHVDSARAPGVFARLDELSTGDRLGVAGEDGWTTVFEVRAVTRHPKAALPAALWRHDDRRVLRLITCGGRFDRSRRSYADNVVVHAAALGRWQPDGSNLVP